jgi:hypothetical protein
MVGGVWMRGDFKMRRKIKLRTTYMRELLYTVVYVMTQRWTYRRLTHSQKEAMMTPQDRKSQLATLTMAMLLQQG